MRSSSLRHVFISADVAIPQLLQEFGDLKTVVTRAEFEELTADLVEELLVPVRRVLDETGLPKSVLDAVTLVGGGSRVPIIQEKLKKLLKRENLDSVSSWRSVCSLSATYLVTLVHTGCLHHRNSTVMRRWRRDWLHTVLHSRRARSSAGTSRLSTLRFQLVCHLHARR